MDSPPHGPAVQKFLARAELSSVSRINVLTRNVDETQVTRALRARLSQASAKASQSESTQTPRPPKRKTTLPSPAPTTRKPAPMQPPAIPQSEATLFTSILAPPPQKQARTILNAADPPRPAPVRPQPRAKRTRRKRDVDGDVEMKAAAALTSLLQHNRPAASPKPEAPTDNEAADLMLFLATSPSPARKAASSDLAAYRALGKGRVLFPTETTSNETLVPGPDLFSEYINASPSPAK